MDIIRKACAWTITIGLAMMGIYLGLVILRVAIDVAGFMLGSTIGTILFVLVMVKIYEKFLKDKLFD